MRRQGFWCKGPQERRPPLVPPVRRHAVGLMCKGHAVRYQGVVQESVYFEMCARAQQALWATKIAAVQSGRCSYTCVLDCAARAAGGAVLGFCSHNPVRLWHCSGCLMLVLSCSSLCILPLLAQLQAHTAVLSTAVLWRECWGRPKAGVHALCAPAWTAHIAARFAVCVFELIMGLLLLQRLLDGTHYRGWDAAVRVPCISICCTVVAPGVAPSESSSRTGLVER